MPLSRWTVTGPVSNTTSAERTWVAPAELAALLFAPFRAGETWALWAIPAGALLVSAGALYAMQTVANATPARPPRGLVLGGTACSLAGFALSLAG